VRARRLRFDDGMSSEVIPRSVTVELLAAFTKDGGGGNPAGVVLDAGAISSTDRQRIATAVGASETAFVVVASDGAFEVEFYSPTKQVPDCGHATVAAFALLAQRGALRGTSAVKRTIIGDRAIALEGDRVFMEQPRPTIAPFPHAEQIAHALGLAPESIAPEPVLADNGIRFVLIEVTPDALAAAVPNQAAIEELTEAPDAIGFYLYARNSSQFDASIRMFAPRVGIPEESATGWAAGLLGSHLAGKTQTTAFRFLQGALMPNPSPSKLIVRVKPDHMLVGGTAAPLRTLEVSL
jgi:PhzF family phenazine biosynthesis protein